MREWNWGRSFKYLVGIASVLSVVLLFDLAVVQPKAEAGGFCLRIGHGRVCVRRKRHRHYRHYRRIRRYRIYRRYPRYRIYRRYRIRRAYRGHGRSRSGRKHHQDTNIASGDAAIQNALNQLGFNAGEPDGRFGPQTRAAIKRYQSSRGAPQTGQLTVTQKLGLYAALDGRGDGTSGYADGSNGGNGGGSGNGYGDASDGGNGYAAGDPTPSYDGYDRVDPATLTGTWMANSANPDDGQVAAASGGENIPTSGEDLPALPEPDNFATTAPSAPGLDLAATCGSRAADALTASASGPISREQADDLAVGQFCLLRAHLVRETSAQLQATPAGTRADMRRQCELGAEQVRPLFSRLALLTEDDLSGEIANLYQLEDDELMGQVQSAKICLGLGLTDRAYDLSLAYATILVGLRERAYAELIAGHLYKGLAIEQNTVAAGRWYAQAAKALGTGVKPIMGNADRAKFLAALAGVLGPKHEADVAAVTEPR